MGRLLDIARAARCDKSDKSDKSPPRAPTDPPFVASVASVAGSIGANDLAPAITTEAVRRCEACGLDPVAELAAGRGGVVLVEMVPGDDGAPWWLCAPCWRGER